MTERQDQPVILIADDDLATRELLRIELEASGYRVVEADDGPAAMDLARHVPLDLVLLDVAMPGADGYEVLRSLHDEPGTADLPVLFLSGRMPGTEAAKALGLGAQDYLRKPYDPAELVARVEAALRVRHQRHDMERRSADLEQLNATDPLTGLYNRRWLVDQLRIVSAAASRSGEAYGVLMVDVDSFKAVNDGWGHEAGDLVLCAVADRLQRSLRAPVAAGRWGGEEFLVVLPSTTYREALVVAERLRSAVSQPLAPAELPLPPGVSISIGCAAGDGADYSDVVRQADAALYRAKAAGRDRVEGTPPQGPPPPPPAPDLPATSAPPSPLDLDERVAAVLSVLAGESETDAAAAAGVEVEMLRRWRQLYQEGGRDRVGGRAPPGSEVVRDRYLAALAHELLIPLTVIKGWSSLQAGGRLTADQAARAPQLILDAVDRMEHTGRDILDSAAVAMGRLRLVVDVVDLYQVAAEAVAATSDPLVELRPAPPVPVVADRARIHQVLTSVCLAARRHGGPGPLEIAVAARGAEAVVTVTSRGEALDFEVAKLLFEPWPTDAVVAGTGIGLYVSRALVVAHGGLLGVQGDGEVTTFWVRLPIGGPPSGELVERKDAP